jgi:hypothetical protein
MGRGRSVSSQFRIKISGILGSGPGVDRPTPELSTEERAEVKKVSRELLTKLNELIILNWRQKAAARSQLRLTIEDVLDNGLPRVYSKETYKEKCSKVFEFNPLQAKVDSIPID